MTTPTLLVLANPTISIGEIVNVNGLKGRKVANNVFIFQAITPDQKRKLAFITLELKRNDIIAELA